MLVCGNVSFKIEKELKIIGGIGQRVAENNGYHHHDRREGGQHGTRQAHFLVIHPPT